MGIGTLSKKFILSISLVFLSEFIQPNLANAWTLRGHQVVCESAIYLVKDPTLRDFLKRRILAMGHLCNLPDFQWVSGPADQLAIGKSSHYLDMDLLGVPFKDISLDYSKVIEKYRTFHPKDPLDATMYRKVGSVWWRANQFFERAATIQPRFESALMKNDVGVWVVKPTEVPKFSEASYDFAVNLGLMGHFVGDNAQPFHLTEDMDGYKLGKGGIHIYYENDVVNALPEDLEGEVLKEARRLRRLKVSWLTQGSLIERMKALSLVTFAEKKAIEDWDLVFKPSEIKEMEGQTIRIPAQRKSAVLTAPKIQKKVVLELARGALLLAQFWDEAFSKAGSPPLLLDTGFKYPAQVEYVEPDYLPSQQKEAPRG